MSSATLSPVSPWAMRYLNRLFVSSAPPNPLNIRIVHGRPRYIVGWMPRVNGYSPGAPRSFPGSNAGTSRGVYSRWTGINEVVVNSFFRSGTLSRERLSAPFSHAFTRSRRASSGSFPMGSSFEYGGRLYNLRPGPFAFSASHVALNREGKATHADSGDHGSVCADLNTTLFGADRLSMPAGIASHGVLARPPMGSIPGSRHPPRGGRPERPEAGAAGPGQGRAAGGARRPFRPRRHRQMEEEGPRLQGRAPQALGRVTGGLLLRNVCSDRAPRQEGLPPLLGEGFGDVGMESRRTPPVRPEGARRGGSPTPLRAVPGRVPRTLG